MKKLFFIIINALPGLLAAQTAERQVIGNAGGFTTTTGLQVSNTVGESVTNTATSGSIILTQGFQQSTINTVGIDDIETGLSVMAFPNPTRDMVTLQLYAEKTVALELSVFDINGKLTSLPVQKLNVNGAMTQAIDFSLLQSGNYILNLQNRNGSLTQAIHILKLD